MIKKSTKSERWRTPVMQPELVPLLCLLLLARANTQSCPIEAQDEFSRSLSKPLHQSLLQYHSDWRRKVPGADNQPDVEVAHFENDAASHLRVMPSVPSSAEKAVRHRAAPTTVSQAAPKVRYTNDSPAGRLHEMPSRYSPVLTARPVVPAARQHVAPASHLHVMPAALSHATSGVSLHVGPSTSLHAGQAAHLQEAKQRLAQHRLQLNGLRRTTLKPQHKHNVREISGEEGRDRLIHHRQHAAPTFSKLELQGKQQRLDVQEHSLDKQGLPHARLPASSKADSRTTGKVVPGRPFPRIGKSSFMGAAEKGEESRIPHGRRYAAATQKTRAELPKTRDVSQRARPTLAASPTERLTIKNAHQGNFNIEHDHRRHNFDESRDRQRTKQRRRQSERHMQSRLGKQGLKQRDKHSAKQSRGQRESHVQRRSGKKSDKKRDKQSVKQRAKHSQSQSQSNPQRHYAEHGQQSRLEKHTGKPSEEEQHVSAGKHAKKPELKLLSFLSKVWACQESACGVSFGLCRDLLMQNLREIIMCIGACFIMWLLIQRNAKRHVAEDSNLDREESQMDRDLMVHNKIGSLIEQEVQEKVSGATQTESCCQNKTAGEEACPKVVADDITNDGSTDMDLTAELGDVSAVTGTAEECAAAVHMSAALPKKYSN